MRFVRRLEFGHNGARPSQFNLNFLNIMYSKMFFPLITRPTIITSYTATLLDNIFINSLDSFCASGVLFSDVSDHLPVFTFLSEKMNVEDKKTWITYREKSAINMA